MKEYEPLNPRIVAAGEFSIAAVSAVATYFIALVIPRPKTPIPFILELWMLWGWVTGVYLSLSFTIFRLAVVRFAKTRTIHYWDVAHGLNVPIVIAGVDTFVVARLIGLL